ncbi:hypothetical protein KCU71_g37, partial [Aureobasidium melanogenum]
MRRTRYASDTKGDVRSRFHQYTSYITVESPTRNPIHTLADRSSRDHMIERPAQLRQMTSSSILATFSRDNLMVSGTVKRFSNAIVKARGRRIYQENCFCFLSSQSPSVDMADPASRYLGCQVGESRGMSYRPPRLSIRYGLVARISRSQTVVSCTTTRSEEAGILLRDGKLFGKRWLVLRGFVGGVDVLLRRILADINAWLYFLEDEDHHLLMSICLRLLKACLGVPGQIW